MKIGELLTVDAIACADFDFEKCDKKEILTKMLENLVPKPVKRFSSKGTYWDLSGEVYNEFDLYINGALLGTSDLTYTFIKDFLNFLPYLACVDDKKLICPFEYEGIITAFVTTPMDNNKIRVSVFHDGALYKKYRPESGFDADIVINKDTFIKQMYKILENMVQDTLKDNEEMDNYWVDRIKYTLGELDKYFDNPEKFKKNYELIRHIRVFDIAYKELDNSWKFITALDYDRDANPIHWEREKKQGNILNYDIFEQYPEDIFDWDIKDKRLKKLTDEEIKEKLENNMDERSDNNWVYSADTEKWYATDEIMPHSDEMCLRCIYRGGINYEIKIGDSSRCEDKELESFINRSYDIDGELIEDNLGYMTCVLILDNRENKVAEISFDYRNHKQIRECLNKVKNGEYARFTLDGNGSFKLHMWQYLYDNSESSDARDLLVACYDMRYNKELYSLLIDKHKFIDCFTHALDEIAHKLDVTKHLMEVGQKLKIKDKFTIDNRYDGMFDYIEPFKGDYACVYQHFRGWGIINRNQEWVIEPKSEIITDNTPSEWGTELKGRVTRCSYLHNIDGKLFIASRNNGEEFVMDIKGDIQIPHVAEKIYYQYLNNELYFLAVDSDKTLFINSKGKLLFQLDFQVGEKFWLFDNIVIVSKDKKYGIVDWKGNLKMDYIFSEIIPDKDSLDFIPVKFVDRWGYINKNGNVMNMNVKETLVTNEKCSQEES